VVSLYDQCVNLGGGLLEQSKCLPHLAEFNGVHNVGFVSDERLTLIDLSFNSLLFVQKSGKILHLLNFLSIPKHGIRL
jgi:hypothetical protein